MFFEMSDVLMINRNSSLPLYIQLADILREQIKSGEIKEGDKLPSETEMIEKYHLGRLTIRDALAILVNEGLLEKHHGKGTFCKSSIVVQKHRIDVILNLSDVSFTPYFLRSICNELENHNVNIVLSDTQNDVDVICSTLEKVLSEGSDGVIFQPNSTSSMAPENLKAVLEKFSNNHTPYIMIDTFYENVPEAFVIMDDFLAGKMAADYFLSLGHTSLCMIEENSHVYSALRFKGFSQACSITPYRIEYSPDLYDSIKDMLKKHPDITGIFCYDGIAQHCYEVLAQLDISIPDDMSVISIDDTLIASTISPTLTSIVHPKEYIGQDAARAIVAIINGENQWPYKKVFNPSLAIRKSCKHI